MIEVRGQNNQLDQNLAPGVTLWVQGSNWNGDAVLTAVDGAVNAGVIALESVGYWWWNSDLIVAGGGTLTDTATGVLTAQAGAGGGRLFQGCLINQGTLTVGTGMQWVGTVANSGAISVAAGVEVDPTGLDGAAPAFSQTGGSLTVDGSLVFRGGALDVEDGLLNGGGTLQVQNAQLSFGAGAGGPLPVEVVGQGDVLLNNLGSVTIWVRGDDLFNQGVLTTAPGAVNAGTILLQSASSWWGSFLSIPDALDNTGTGVIHVTAGAGGGRSITGDLTNEGTVLVDADATVEIDGASLTQNDGLVRADGRLTFNGGLLDFEGGAVTGYFYAENAQIYVSPDVADPSLIHVVGGGDVLLDNASAATTILVQGDDADNAGVLTVAPDATNAGVIQLDSASAYWGSSLVLQDMLDNTPTGSILVTPGAGGGRSIVGDIDNEGLLSVAAGLQVEIDGATDAGPTFVQDGGAIQADGRLTLEGGLFDFEAGDVSGSFYVDNSRIYVGPGATDAATVYVVGAYNTLLGNEGPSVTLRVEGGGDNRGVLTAAAGAVNAGSIVLGSTSSYWGSALVAPDTLLNAQGGLIAVADDGGGGTLAGRRLPQRRHDLRARKLPTLPRRRLGRRPDADPRGRPDHRGRRLRAGRRPVRLPVRPTRGRLRRQRRPNLRRPRRDGAFHRTGRRAEQHAAGQRLGFDDAVGPRRRRLQRRRADGRGRRGQLRHDPSGLGQRLLAQRAGRPGRVRQPGGRHDRRLRRRRGGRPDGDADQRRLPVAQRRRRHGRRYAGQQRRGRGGRHGPVGGAGVEALIDAGRPAGRGPPAPAAMPRRRPTGPRGRTRSRA